MPCPDELRPCRRQAVSARLHGEPPDENAVNWRAILLERHAARRYRLRPVGDGSFGQLSLRRGDGQRPTG